MFRKVFVDPAVQRVAEGGRGLRGLLGLRDPLLSQFRLVKKDGDLNMKFRQLEFSNPLSLDNCIWMNWVTIIWLLVVGFLISWLAFASVYFIAEYFSGNICTINATEGCFRNPKDVEMSRCVTGLYDFNSALQFSIETMTTIGYGSRALNSGVTRCYVVILTVMAQHMTGLVLTAILTGIFIVKFKHSAPNKKIVSFSPKAGLNKRNNKIFLDVVVSSKRKIFDAAVEGFWIFEYTSEEGRKTKRFMQSLPFSMENSSDVSDNFVHVMWPIKICHEVTKNSPFYKFKSEENFTDFEIIVLFQGTTSTGATVNVRQSYIKSEIVSGGKFNFSCVLHQRKPSKHITVDDSRIFEMDDNIKLSDSAYDIDQKKWNLDKNLGQTPKMAYDNENKLDELTRKLTVQEEDLKRANERAELAESKLKSME